MQCDFYQHKPFEKNWYTFTDEGIRVSQQKFRKYNEYELKFEEIGNKVIQYKGGSRGWLIPAIVLPSIALLLFLDRQSGGDVERGADLLYLSVGLICAVVYFLTFKNCCYLTKSSNVNAIEFLNNRPSQAALDTFIAQISSRRKDFLMQRYGQLNNKLSYEPQFNNLAWLLDNGVLNQEEYKKKLAELERFYLSETTLNRFTFSNN